MIFQRTFDFECLTTFGANITFVGYFVMFFIVSVFLFLVLVLLGPSAFVFFSGGVPLASLPGVPPIPLVGGFGVGVLPTVGTGSVVSPTAPILSTADFGHGDIAAYLTITTSVIGRPLGCGV